MTNRLVKDSVGLIESEYEINGSRQMEGLHRGPEARENIARG